MPNKYTFQIKPIKELLDRYVQDLGCGWANPFCGHSLLGEFRNDLDPDNAFALHHLPALDFLKSIPDNKCAGVLFDPPYSPRQMSECYKSIGMKTTKEMTQGFHKEKRESARIIRPGGLAICFGWNTNGIGKKYGFEMVEILLVAHGGNHNDTIVTVERKLNPKEKKRDE